MPSESYFLRQAATLLRFAKQTGDPKLAAGLLDKAAELNDKVEDVSLKNMDVRAQAPDVEAANVICDGFSVAEQENTRPSRFRSLQTT